MKSKTLLFGPKLKKEQHIEYSIHKCPKLLFRDLKNIFPEQNFDIDTLFIIPTFQPTNCDMLEFTKDSEIQKNLLLQNFLSFSEKLRSKLKDDYFIDYIDPITGAPQYSSQGGTLYSDVDSCEMLLKYKVDDVLGGCRMISHPNWKMNVYPATILTDAPLEKLIELLTSEE
eukprot:gene5854-9682_t